MSGGIYLIQEDERLIRMDERQYDSEDLLQTLLARYPDLLAGELIDSVAPRKWLLIAREAALASEENGPNRWSVDHLFMDQDAVPTIVEVKRSSDTRIRREVVGQMLDYAANAVVYWPIEKLQAQFEANCAASNQDAGLLLAEFLGGESDSDTFWQRAKTNLQAGRIRMLFVADSIPPELKRIVEFLNGQMDPAEILAIEIKQYVGEGRKTLVPRVIGQTAGAEQKKSAGGREFRKWDEPSFFEDLEARRGPAESAVARKLLEWAKRAMPEIWWGEGKKDGSFLPGLTHKGTWRRIFAIYAYGRLEIHFQYFRSEPPFDDSSRRLELLRRLNEVPGVNIPEDGTERRPSIPLSALIDGTALGQFINVLDWYVEQVKAS
jgi:hypothetical protein